MRPPPPVRRNPYFDPRLNPWPRPPGWMTRHGEPLPKAWMNPGFIPPPPPEDPRWGNALGSGGGHPGIEGNLFIGKRHAPDTGGWVYGLENWYPTPPGRRPNPYTGAPRGAVPVSTLPPPPPLRRA